MDLDTRNPLLFPDLFPNILDHLSDCDYVESLVTRDERAALLALARTCRGFSEPCLDRLWCGLGSLKPLIRCYGGKLERRYYNTDYDKKLPPPTSSELDIIRRYSPRIRTLYLRDSPSMLLLRYIGLQSSSFFPNLTCLFYDDSDTRRFSLPPVPMSTLACLLTPQVTSLEIVFAKRVDGVQAFLRDLHQICPNLRTFTFQAKYDGGRPDDTCPLQTLHRVPDFSRFKSLQYVSLQAVIDHITLENLSLSSLPGRFSAVVRRNQATPFETSLGPADIPFRHAKHVKLWVWDLDILTNLLRPSHQAFDYIDVFIGEDRPTASSVDAFFKALASAGRADSLQTIQLRWPLRDQFTPGHISSDVPSFLTSFRRLETLVIDLGNISIDDYQLAALGCLRSLRVLELTSRAASWSSVKRPTLRGVLSLVGSCQQLEALTLCIDARQVPRDADASIRNTTLTTLNSLYSPIDNSNRVAQFISQHFPSVKQVDVEWPAGDSPWYSWHEWSRVNHKLRLGVHS